mgnify:CR=1 FL=1
MVVSCPNDFFSMGFAYLRHVLNSRVEWCRLLRVVSRELWHKDFNLCRKATDQIMELEPYQAGAKKPRAELSRVDPSVSLLNPALLRCSQGSHWDLKSNFVLMWGDFWMTILSQVIGTKLYFYWLSRSTSVWAKSQARMGWVWRKSVGLTHQQQKRTRICDMCQMMGIFVETILAEIWALSSGHQHIYVK